MRKETEMDLDNYLLALPKGFSVPFRVDHVADDRLKSLKLHRASFNTSTGEGSLRGQVYTDFVAFVSDGKFTLYEDRISPKGLTEIASCIGQWLDKTDGDWSETHTVTRQEAADLKLMFEIGAEIGADLYSWY